MPHFAAGPKTKNLEALKPNMANVFDKRIFPMKNPGHGNQGSKNQMLLKDCVEHPSMLQPLLIVGKIKN